MIICSYTSYKLEAGLPFKALICCASLALMGCRTGTVQLWGRAPRPGAGQSHKPLARGSLGVTG